MKYMVYSPHLPLIALTRRARPQVLGSATPFRPFNKTGQ